MNAGKPPVVVDIEKGGVSEGIDAAKHHLERGEIADRTLCHRDEFLKTVERELIAVLGCIAQESQFLNRDVEKAIGMQADER